MKKATASASPAMEDAIRALEAARAEKYTVDRLSSQAQALAEIAKRRLQDAETEVRRANTSDMKALAKQQADKARTTAKRAEEVRRQAAQIAARKAAAESTAENQLARLRALEVQSVKKSTGHFRWFPGIAIPLIFFLIVAAAVNTARQTDFTQQWNTVTRWFGQTFVSTPSPAGDVQQTAEPVEILYTEPPADGGLIPIGASCATDRVQVTLTAVSFSDVVLFQPGNWLNPVSKSGISAEDGSTFVFFYFTVRNLSDTWLTTEDFCNVALEFNGVLYTGAEYGYEESKPSAAVESGQDADVSNLSAEAEAGLLAQHSSRNYFGYLSCTDEVKTNSDSVLTVNFTLPSSKGVVVYSYGSHESHPATNTKNSAVAEALQALSVNLTTIRDRVGQTDENGSRAFDQDFIASTRNALADLDEDYIMENLPVTANKLTDIQQNVKSICNKLEVMGINNSAGNVEKIKSLSSRTIALIQGLFDTELKAYK